VGEACPQASPGRLFRLLPAAKTEQLPNLPLARAGRNGGGGKRETAQRLRSTAQGGPAGVARGGQEDGSGESAAFHLGGRQRWRRRAQRRRAAHGPWTGRSGQQTVGGRSGR